MNRFMSIELSVVVLARPSDLSTHRHLGQKLFLGKLIFYQNLGTPRYRSTFSGERPTQMFLAKSF